MSRVDGSRAVMHQRRRWSPSTQGRADRTRALSAAHRPSAHRNERYVSSSGALDADRSAGRFVAPASIDNWRERMRRDAAVRDALLNPVDYEPDDDR